MIRTSKACHWITQANSLFALGLLVAFPHDALGAAVDSILDDGAKAGATEVHYLEVVLNEMPTGRVAPFTMVDGRLAATAKTLRELGLRWPGSQEADDQELIILDRLPGLHVEYVIAKEQVRLLAPLDMLSGTRRHIGYVPPNPAVIDPSTRATGLTLNYDIYGQDSEYARSLSGWTEMRLFSKFGIVSNSMVTRYSDSNGADSQFRNTRLDTSWQVDFPDHMLSLAIGDSATGALAWTRATRFGGIRLSRNFALQPYRVYTPLMSFTGESVLPGTVDLLIDGVRRSSSQVLPGQFQIDSVPSMSGAGQAQVSITDINGRVQTINVSVYGTQQLLQKGLSDWSVELGNVRRDYGLNSFSYRSDPMASATGRFGLTNRLTLEGHAEATDGLIAAGAGGTWLVGSRGGVFSLAAAGSQHRGRQGAQVYAAYQWSSAGFNIGLSATERTADFRDVASLESGGLLARRTLQAYAGVSSPLGYLSASYIEQKRDGEARSRLVGMNWSKQLFDNVLLSVNGYQDLRDKNPSIYMHLSIPFGRYTRTAVSARHTSESDDVAVEARRFVQTDIGGWGWRVQAATGDATSGQAEITRLTQAGQWTAGVSQYEGSSRPSVYGSASGSFVLMGGHVRAMRRVDDAFAMVSTDGVEGVPVRLENRLVGRTDADGLLLLNRLNAYQRNLVSIDTLDLPVDMQVERTRIEAVPATRSGTLVKFPMQRILSVRLILRDGPGTLLPAGSEVHVVGDKMQSGATLDTVVGFDGVVYLQNPVSGATLSVSTAQSRCQATLPDLTERTGLVDLGELVCQ